MMFPAERDGIDKCFFMMDKIYTESIKTMCGDDDISLPYDLMEMSFYDLLSSFVSGERLKLALSTYCPFLGLPAREASAVALSNILMHYVKGGSFRIRGGFQKLSDVLVDELRAHGGEFFINEEVARILYDGNRTMGIITKSNHEVKAEHVISNIDLKTALRLMDGCAVDKKRVSKIDTMKVSSSFVMVYLGVKDNLNSYGLPSNMGCFSSCDFDKMLNKGSGASFGISFPSLLDSSVAPEGCGSVVMHWPLWYSENPANLSKNTICKGLVNDLNKIVPGIVNRIAYQSVAGPNTLHRYTGNTLGAVVS